MLTDDLSPEEYLFNVEIVLKLLKSELDLESLFNVKGHSVEVDVL